MKTIIPAAGIGKRLRPHTFNRPKVMVPVAGKPILEHIAESLFASGFDKLSVIVGYKKETVTDYFDKYYPGKFFFFEQKEMKGLAHAVLYGLEDKDEPVLIILGDTIIDMDLSIFHDSKYNIIAVVEVDDPSRFGIVETDEAGNISGMVEKPEDPPSNLAIAGVYFLRSQKRLKNAIEALIAQEIKTRGEYQLTDALKIMMDKGEKFKAVPIKAWYDCGTPETLLSTSAYLLSKRSINHGECINSKIIEPVYIAQGAVVKDSVIGPNAAIGEHAVISDSSIANSMINEGAVINNSDLSGSIVGMGSRIMNYTGKINIGDNDTADNDHNS